jgi:hypothetical protein
MTGKKYTVFYYINVGRAYLATYKHITLNDDEDLKQFDRTHDEEIFYIAEGHVTNLLEELYPNEEK